MFALCYKAELFTQINGYGRGNEFHRQLVEDIGNMLQRQFSQVGDVSVT